MKYLLPLLILSLLFSQELEVEGDLKVTGTVINDSLQQVIANMQAQIDAMHADNQLETRVYELPRFNFSGYTTEEFYLSDIIGDSLDYAIVTIVYVSDYQTSVSSSTGIKIQREIEMYSGYAWNNEVGVTLQGGDATGVHYASGHLIVTGEKLRFIQDYDNTVHTGYVDMSISVTALFPD